MIICFFASLVIINSGDIMIIKLPERLKELRELNHITQSQLAQEMNVTRSSVNAWEMGISMPTVTKLVELALRFSVSTDYLLGLTADKSISLQSFNFREQEIISALVEYFRYNRHNTMQNDS